MLDGIQPNDEGLMLQAAARIADGQVPYRDFWWFYPPGQPYLLARAVGAVRAVAALVAGRCACSRRGRSRCSSWRARRARRGAAAAWRSRRGSWPRSRWRTRPARTRSRRRSRCASARSCLIERRPALAGALAGVAAFWRIEFAAYLALGILLGVRGAANGGR